MKPKFEKISIGTMWKSSKIHLYHGNRPKFKINTPRQQRQKDSGYVGRRRLSNGNHQVRFREIMQERFLHKDKVLQRKILPNFTTLRFLDILAPPTVMTSAPIDRTSGYGSLVSISIAENPFNFVGEDPTSWSDSVRSSHLLSSLGIHSLNSVPLELIFQDSENLGEPGSYGGISTSELVENQVDSNGQNEILQTPTRRIASYEENNNIGRNALTSYLEEPTRMLNNYQKEDIYPDLFRSSYVSLSSFPSSNACNSELSSKGIDSCENLISLCNEFRALGTVVSLSNPGDTSVSDPQHQSRSSSPQSEGISELNIFETNQEFSSPTFEWREPPSEMESLASIFSTSSFEDYGKSQENPTDLPLTGHSSEHSCRNSPADAMSLPCHQSVGTQSIVPVLHQTHLSGQQTSPCSIAVDKNSSCSLAEIFSASLHAEQTEEETSIFHEGLSTGDAGSLPEIFHAQGLEVVRLQSTLHHVHGDVQAALSPALINSLSQQGILDWDQMPEIEEAHLLGVEEEAQLLGVEESTNELMLIPLTPHRGQQESDQVQEDDVDLSLLSLGPPNPVLLGFPQPDDVDVNDIDIDLHLMRINRHPN